MSLRTTLAVTAAALGFAVAAPLASANLLVNPSFEDPALTGGDQGGTTGFSSTGPVATLHIGYSNSGDQSLKVSNQGRAFQTFTASVGQTYVGSVTAINPAQDPLTGDTEGQLQVNFLDSTGGLLLSNVVTVATADTSLTGAGQPFTPFTTGQVVAPAGTAQVEFAIFVAALTDRNGDGAVTPGGSTFFDDASLEVSSVPEPTALGLLAAGGLLLARRRR